MSTGPESYSAMQNGGLCLLWSTVLYNRRWGWLTVVDTITPEPGKWSRKISGSRPGFRATWAARDCLKKTEWKRKGCGAGSKHRRRQQTWGLHNLQIVYISSHLYLPTLVSAEAHNAGPSRHPVSLWAPSVSWRPHTLTHKRIWGSFWFYRLRSNRDIRLFTGKRNINALTEPQNEKFKTQVVCQLFVSPCQ